MRQHGHDQNPEENHPRDERNRAQDMEAPGMQSSKLTRGILNR